MAFRAARKARRDDRKPSVCMSLAERRAMILHAALLSLLVAIAELTTAMHGIVGVWMERQDVATVTPEAPARARNHYNYYVEFENGTRIRQFVPIVYDDRRAQTLFLHNVLLAFALPGLGMPLLLYIAHRREKHHLYVWWICWITLQNVHSLVDFFVMLIKCLVNLRCAILSDELEKLAINWNSVCFIATLTKDLLTPFAIYLSLAVLALYRRLTVHSTRYKCGIVPKTALARYSLDT